jgi:hypothetical protein
MRGQRLDIAWGEIGVRLLHPLKVAILEAMVWIDRPLSAKELWHVFGGSEEPQLSAVSYHLNALAEEKIGATTKVDEEPVRGSMKTYYELVPDFVIRSQRSVLLSPDLKAAIRQYVIAHLARIEGELLFAQVRDDPEQMAEFALAYSDELRLLAEDLGWGPGAPVDGALRTPPEVLRRLFSRLRADEEQVKKELVEGLDDDELLTERVMAATSEVLRQLDDSGGPNG